MANFEVNDIPPKVMKELTKCDCKAQLNALLDRVEKEVVGENKEVTLHTEVFDTNEEDVRNQLREEQRAALKEIRKEIK